MTKTEFDAWLALASPADMLGHLAELEDAHDQQMRTRVVAIMDRLLFHAYPGRNETDRFRLWAMAQMEADLQSLKAEVSFERDATR